MRALIRRGYGTIRGVVDGGEIVGVCVGVCVGVDVSVDVEVDVGVSVEVDVGIGVAVGVDVEVGVGKVVGDGHLVSDSGSLQPPWVTAASNIPSPANISGIQYVVFLQS